MRKEVLDLFNKPFFFVWPDCVGWDSRAGVGNLKRPGRAFALFYTGVIGSGGLAPIAFGAIADHSNRTVGVLAAAATAALIVPMALRLGPSLKR